MVWTINPEGSVEFLNNRWIEYTGLTLEDVKRSGWITTFYSEDAPRCIHAWDDGLNRGDAFEFECRIVGREGTAKWHLIQILPLKSQEGKIVQWIATATSVENQKEILNIFYAERDLRNEFVATLTHDLRTPLTSIKISAELALKMRENLYLRDKCLLRICKDIDRTHHMITDLLDVSRIRAGKMLPLRLSKCDLKSLIASTLEEMKFLYGDRFVFNCNEPVVRFWDADGIRRMMENLCNNAVKYGCPVSPITITLRKMENKIELLVHNHGSLLSAQDQASVFHPFQRDQAAQESGKTGWGIGLALVHGVIEAHGGEIKVESTVENGTTFIAVFSPL